MSCASISPPNSCPLTDTPMDPMSTTGNLPSASLPTSITMPSTVPENCRSSPPFMPVMLADRMSLKSAGWAWMSSQVIPIWVMAMGNQLGHLKLPPVAPPTLRNTPNPGLVLKLPSPVKAKLRASPPITSEPTLTTAPMERKDIRSSSGPAPVSSIISVAVRVRN